MTKVGMFGQMELLERENPQDAYKINFSHVF